jgi:hypothetical protein
MSDKIITLYGDVLALPSAQIPQPRFALILNANKSGLQNSREDNANTPCNPINLKDRYQIKNPTEIVFLEAGRYVGFAAW